jgi:hypothetical protein
MSKAHHASSGKHPQQSIAIPDSMVQTNGDSSSRESGESEILDINAFLEDFTRRKSDRGVSYDSPSATWD